MWRGVRWGGVVSLTLFLLAGCERRSATEGPSQAEQERSLTPPPSELVAPAGRPLPGPEPTFLGRSTDDILHIISTARPIGARGTSGQSLSMYINLDGDDDAAFKPYTNVGQRWNGEIAAYRLGRLLGVTRIPPAITRKVRAPLIRGLLADEPDDLERFNDEAVFDNDSLVKGAFVYWVPVIHPAEVDQSHELEQWTRWLKHGAAIPPERLDLARQLSDTIAFDYVAGNWDRWSGGNVYFAADESTLLVMDNNAGFGTTFSPRIQERLDAPIAQVERYSAVFYRRLVGLNEADIRTELSHDPSGETLLTDAQISGVLDRRETLIRRIETLAERHGHDAVLCFP